MARAPKEPSIRFTAGFDHVEVAQTVRYAPGDVVNNPSAALREAAEGKFEVADEAEAAPAEPVDDGK